MHVAFLRERVFLRVVSPSTAVELKSQVLRSPVRAHLINIYAVGLHLLSAHGRQPFGQLLMVEEVGAACSACIYERILAAALRVSYIPE